MSHHILIIEDEPDISLMVEVMLQDAGYRYQIAKTGHEGLTQLAQQQPDLVILDLMLPDMDGWEVFRLLKANPGTTDIPVLIATARLKELGRKVNTARQPDGWLAKPFVKCELLDMVESLLARSGRLHVPGQYTGAQLHSQ